MGQAGRPSAAEWLLIGALTGAAVAVAALVHGSGEDAPPGVWFALLWALALAGGKGLRDEGFLPWQRALHRSEQAKVYGLAALVLSAWVIAGATYRLPGHSGLSGRTVGIVAECVIGAALLEVALLGLVYWWLDRIGRRDSQPYVSAFCVGAGASVVGGTFFALAGYGLVPVWPAAMAGFVVGSIMGPTGAALVGSELRHSGGEWLMAAVLALLLTVLNVFVPPPPEAVRPAYEALHAGSRAVLAFGYLCALVLPLPFWFCYSACVRRLTLAHGLLVLPLSAAVVGWPLVVALRSTPGDAYLAAFFAQLAPLGLLYVIEYLPQDHGDGFHDNAVYPWTGRCAELLGFWVLGWLSLLTVVPVASASGAWFTWLVGHFPAFGG